jgi:uncharacterized protein (TIGR02594 family)
MPLTKQDNSAMTKVETLRVQTRLKELGFDPGPLDGEMGPHTESAIIAFKRSHGLKPRAYVGERTWEALFDYQPTLDTDLDELPWIAWGRRLIGLDEVRDNAELRKILASDGHALGDPAKFPWCGDFVETGIKLHLPNEPFTGALAKNPYWALNWREFGIATKPTYGCVASISRNGGGHVMFLVGEDDHRYYALGGNQSNSVSIVPVDKGRFEAASFRWPLSFPTRPIYLPRLVSGQKSNTQEG